MPTLPENYEPVKVLPTFTAETLIFTNQNKFKGGSKKWGRYRNQPKPAHLQKENQYRRILKKQGIKFNEYRIREGEFIPGCFSNAFAGSVAPKPGVIFQF